MTQQSENRALTTTGAKDDIDVDELLSGGYLSGAQYDAIFDRVLHAKARPAQQPKPARRLRPAPMLSLAALLAAIAGLYLVSTRQLDEPVGFRSKDVSSTSPIAAIELACGERSSRAGTLRCPLGSTLMFTFQNSFSPRYLAAFAVPRDSDEARIWYFPTVAGDLPAIAAAEGTSVLDKGVVLGAPHQSGPYLVTVYLLSDRMTRDALGALPDDPTATFELQIE